MKPSVNNLMRTFTFSGANVNAAKTEALTLLLREYRSYVNASLSVLSRSFYETSKAPQKYPARLEVSELSERYKQVAGAQSKDMINPWLGVTKTNFKSIVASANLPDELKYQLFYINEAGLWFTKALTIKEEVVAQETLKLARKICKNVAGRRPKLRRLSARIDAKVAQVTKAEGGRFDYWVKVSTLTRGKPILLPISSYNHFELTKGKLKNIVQLGVNAGKLTIGLVKEITPKVTEKAPRTELLRIGIDVGMTTLISISNGQRFGRGLFRKIKRYDEIIQKLVKGRQKAGLSIRCERYDSLVGKVRSMIKNEVGRCVNKVIKDINPDVIVIEALSGMTQNTMEEGRLSKRMRRLLSNCGIRRIADLLVMRQEEYGYKVEEINPAYTSQECRNCHHTEKSNRNGERFKCRLCGKKSDANHNGSVNTLSRSSTPTIRRWTPKKEVKELLATLASRHHAVYSSAMSTDHKVRRQNQVLDKRL